MAKKYKKDHVVGMVIVASLVAGAVFGIFRWFDVDFNKSNALCSAYDWNWCYDIGRQMRIYERNCANRRANCQSARDYRDLYDSRGCSICIDGKRATISDF